MISNNPNLENNRDNLKSPKHQSKTGEIPFEETNSEKNINKDNDTILLEKQEKTGNPVFKEMREEQIKNRDHKKEIKNIGIGVGGETHRQIAHIKVDNFTISKDRNEYVLFYKDEEIHRASRLTELITLEDDLYGITNVVKDVEEKILELFIKDENLFDKIVQFFDKYIAEDYLTRKYILLTLFSAFTENPLNLAIKAPTSEGKTHNVVTIAKFFPKENIIMLGSASPTSLIHDTNAILVDKDLKPIEDKLNSIEEEKKEANNKEKKRLAEERRELLREAKYLVDLRNKVLIFLEEPNQELWKKLRPILSHDEEFIEYRITDKSKSGSFLVKNVVIRGFPAVIYCTTRVDDLAIEDELKSRFLSVTTESKKEKYEKALKLIAFKESFSALIKEREDVLIKKLIFRIVEIFKKKSKDVLLPCFEDIIESFYSNFSSGVILRQAKEIAQFVKAHTLIHYESRPKIKIAGVKYALATIEDYKAVFDLFSENNIFVEPHVLTFFNNIKDFLEEREYVSIEDVIEFLRYSGKIYTTDSIRKYLNSLSSSGFLTKNKDPEDRRKSIYSLRYIALQDFRGTKNFYNKLNLRKFTQELIKLITNTSKVSKSKEYLSIEFSDPITGYEETLSGENCLDFECVYVPLKKIYFSNQVNNVDSEKEADSLEKKHVFQFFPVSSNEKTDSIEVENSDEYVTVKVIKIPPHPPECDCYEFVGVDGKTYRIEKEGQILLIPKLNAKPLLERSYVMRISNTKEMKKEVWGDLEPDEEVDKLWNDPWSD